MTLRRCTRHESCSTSTEQTGITRSAHWADWKVVGGRSAGSRHWRISGMWCMLTGSERGLLIARHATEAICCSAFVDTGEQKSYLHVQKEHGFTPTWLTIQNFGRNHIQFLHRHHYQSTRQYDSILKTCLKWESTSLPSDAPARRRTCIILLSLIKALSVLQLSEGVLLSSSARCCFQSNQDVVQWFPNGTEPLQGDAVWFL